MDSTVKSAETHRKEGNFDLAIDEFKEALDLARKISNKEEEIKCLISLGLLYWNIGQLEESSKKYKQALSLAQKFNLIDLQKKCRISLEIYRLYREGKKFCSSCEYQKSIESFHQAIELAKKIGSKEHEVKCRRQMSYTYWELNKLKKYLSLNKEALKIAQSLKHKKENSKSLISIGNFYWKLDNYSEALNSYQEAFRIIQGLKNKENESICLTNIGVIYEKIGNYDKALEYLTKALTIDKQLGDDVYISMDLNNIGESFRSKGIITGNNKDFHIALDYFNACLKLTRKTGDKKTEVYVLNNIGLVHADLRNYFDALKYFQSAYEKAEEIQDIEAMGMILTNTGIVHFDQGNYEEAIKSYFKAIELANKISGRQIVWEAYFGLGKCHEKRNKFTQAVMCYKRAIDNIDQIRSQIFLDTHKAGFVRDKLQVYELLISLLYRLNIDDPSGGHAKEIFHVVERAKARAFLESLGESKVNIRESLNSELKNRENEISRRISFIIQELSKPDLFKKRRKELLTELQQEEDEYISLISKMRVEVPEVANLVLPSPCNAVQVQQLFDGKTALMEYFLGERQSFMFFITNDKFDVYSLPTRREIEKSIRVYLKVLSDSPKGEFKGIAASKRIYKELLFSAVRDILESVENLIIVPDGILYYLPFETLIPYTQDQTSQDDYLIADYKISYAPSSSALLFLSGKKLNHESPKGLLAFGNPSYTFRDSSKEKRYKTDVEISRELYLNQGFNFSPLPYTEREILEISRYFPEEKRDIYLKDEAREETFKKVSLRDYQIIHFACHGFLAEEFPFRSALVLSLDEDPQEDGFLQVREIYNLRLKADLVVLSACQTGKGKLERGEGVLGLPRVFFYTGARSVVSTLWRINDESTATLMNSFYGYLSQGNDKAQALRLAKLEMINSKFSHPFYWAAFVLNGDSNSTLNFE